MSKKEEQFDILIMGGGMVGSTLACALAHLPLRIAIVDPNKFTAPENPTQFDLRVSAITRASQQIFEALDVWQDMTVYPFRDMRVWQEPSSEIHFDSAHLGDAQLGHIVENREILNALHKSMAMQENLDCVFGHRGKTLNYDEREKQWCAQLDDGAYIKTKLLLAADGGRSWTRQQLEISQRGWDYKHDAIVTYVKTEKPHEFTAWQRFLPQGPLAFLPLAENICSIVWSTHPEHAAELMSLSDDEFARELEMAYESRLGAIEEVAPRVSFPLKFAESNQYISKQAALVGDAAHSMHPLAGQGVNLGLADAASLAQVIEQACEAKTSFYSHRNLRQYERWRKSENLTMLAGVDTIQRLFASTAPSVSWARGQGMAMVNKVGPVKDHIIESAMGLAGDLPKLARTF